MFSLIFSLFKISCFKMVIDAFFQVLYFSCLLMIWIVNIYIFMCENSDKPAGMTDRPNLKLQYVTSLPNS